MEIKAQFFYVSPRSEDARFGFKEESRRYLKNLKPLVVKLTNVEEFLKRGSIEALAYINDSTSFGFFINADNVSFSGAVDKLFSDAGFPVRIKSSNQGYSLIENLLEKRSKKLRKFFGWPFSEGRYIDDKK